MAEINPTTRPALETITWKCTIPGPLAGKTLNHGHVIVHATAGRAVDFGEVKLGTRRLAVTIKIEGADRESLLPLVEAYEASLVMQREWDAARKAEARAEWNEKIAALDIPAGCILASDHGDAWEGNQSYSLTLDGVEYTHLTHHEVKAEAHFSFVHQGRKWFFAALPEAKVRTMLAQIEQTRIEKEAARAAYQANLLAMEIPPEARDAFARYHGSAERAWEREDEHAWALINQYQEAIEAQG